MMISDKFRKLVKVSELTTSFHSLPSADFFVIAEAGVSGSINPVRKFVSVPLSPTSRHNVSPASQTEPDGFCSPRTAVLQKISFRASIYAKRGYRSYRTGYPMNSIRRPSVNKTKPPPLTIPRRFQMSQSRSLSFGSGLCK